MAGDRTAISHGGKRERIIASRLSLQACKCQADAARAEENCGLISICSQQTDNMGTIG